MLHYYSIIVNVIPVGLVKFFGNLAIMDSPQQVCETYPAFQNKVFEMALDPDPVMIGVALDTLGLLGSTVEGKQVLQKTGLLVTFYSVEAKGAIVRLMLYLQLISWDLCVCRRKVQGRFDENESACQLWSY